MDNKYYPYNGGNIEEVPAGETDGISRETGQPVHFIWQNHVRVTGRSFKSKLNGVAVRAIVDLYEREESFREWCERC